MESGISLYDALVSVNVPAEKARAVVQGLEKEMFERLATKQDLKELSHKIELLDSQLTVKLGGMLVAAVGLAVALVAAIVKILH